MPILPDIFKKFQAWLNRFGASKKTRTKNVRREVRPKAPVKRPQRKTAPRTRPKTSNRTSTADKRSSKSPTPKSKPTQSKSKSASPRKPAPRKKTTTTPRTNKRSQQSGVIRPSSMASPETRRPKRRTRANPLNAKSPEIGEITHYFANIKVAVIKVSGQGLRLGDKINIKGKTTDLLQKVESMQIESVDVKAAKKGQLVGLKLTKPARVGDKVFIVA